MIDFMVIGLPRSGTTWAANWLCTPDLHCIHDPLYRYHYRQWDALDVPGKALGVSCTGIWQWSAWVNAHPARKVILHRDLAEVNESLAEIGFPACDAAGPAQLHKIDGLHVPFSDLFRPESAAVIWHHLTGQDLDAARHAELVQIEMQPKFAGLTVGAEVTRELLAEIMEIVGGRP